MKPVFSFLAAALFGLSFSLAGSAAAQTAYTGAAHGHIGSKPASEKPAPAIPADEDSMSENDFNTMVDEMPQAQTPVLMPVEPEAPVTGHADPAQMDACKDFMGSHDAYAACQDRNIKIQRMKDGQQKRKDARLLKTQSADKKPPVAEEPVADAPAEPVKDGGAVKGKDAQFKTPALKTEKK